MSELGWVLWVGYGGWRKLVLLFNYIKMRLPKGVVKWVKDDFNLEKAELKLLQQEEQIEKLQRHVAWYRFQLLSPEERRWVMDAYWILVGEFFWAKYEAFIQEYMCQRDEEEARKRKEEREKLWF